MGFWRCEFLAPWARDTPRTRIGRDFLSIRLPTTVARWFDCGLAGDLAPPILQVFGPLNGCDDGLD